MRWSSRASAAVVCSDRCDGTARADVALTAVVGERRRRDAADVLAALAHAGAALVLNRRPSAAAPALSSDISCNARVYAPSAIARTRSTTCQRRQACSLTCARLAHACSAQRLYFTCCRHRTSARAYTAANSFVAASSTSSSDVVKIRCLARPVDDSFLRIVVAAAASRRCCR